MGYSPFAPGTVGTLGAIGLFYILSLYSSSVYLISTVLLIAFSIYVSNRAIVIFNEADPGKIVIDEVCGFIVSMFLIPFGLFNVVAGFFIFRIFDILKPYPVRKLESLREGYGVVLDDVAAGVYTNIVLQLIIYFK